MGRKQYTPEERQAVKARRDLLAETARIIEEERPADIDKAAAILSKYSRRNVALILAQAEQRGQQFPQAVAGFHTWREVGRSVCKGARGYMVFAPRIKDGEFDGYTVTHVFDVIDTEPITDQAPATLRELIAS